MSPAPPDVSSVRAAEVIGALCLATDLGMGFAFEHGLQSTLVASRLGERLGIDRETASQTYYACLARLLRLHRRRGYGRADLRR
jgi:hypothetical protein